MAVGPGIKHPAKTLLLLTALTSALAFILSLIAIFVPWSWKDTAVFERRTVTLWQNCMEYTNQPLNAYSCWNNDIDQVGSVAGGSKKCRGYFAATQVFTVASCVFAFLTLLLALYTMTKLWSKPVALAAYTALLAFLTFGCALVAFLMWIVFAEQNCQPGNPMFPWKNYSWGWILEVIATFFAFLAMLLAYLALYKTLLFKPFIPHEQPPMYPAAQQAPVYMEPQPYYEPYVMPAYPAAY